MLSIHYKIRGYKKSDKPLPIGWRCQRWSWSRKRDGDLWNTCNSKLKLRIWLKRSTLGPDNQLRWSLCSTWVAWASWQSRQRRWWPSRGRRWGREWARRLVRLALLLPGGPWCSWSWSWCSSSLVDHEGDAEDPKDDQHEVDAGQVALQQALLLLLPPLASLGVHLFAKCRLLKIVARLVQVLEEHLVA